MSPFSGTKQVVGSKLAFPLGPPLPPNTPSIPAAAPGEGPILPAAAAPAAAAAASEGPRVGKHPTGWQSFLGELLNSPQPRLFNQLLANRDVCASGRVIPIIWKLFCSRCRPGQSAFYCCRVENRDGPAPPQEKGEERRSLTFFP